MSEDLAFRVFMWTSGIVLGALALVLVFMVVGLVFRPLPTCPDGHVLAGGGYGGRYHCILGAEPRR